MRAFILGLMVLTGGAADADPVLGLWQTEPDRKRLVSHIEITRCGPAICGRVAVAFDPSGKTVQTPHVGRPLFWDMQAQGAGRYTGGTVYVPLLDITARASMQLQGDRLTVTGCKGPVCDGQVWTRLR